MLNRRQFVAGCATLPLLPQSLYAESLVQAQAPVKVLLDTDIGSDIDDAVALAYLLRQTRCRLLGITTVTGEAAKRVALAKALCHAAGQNIPVYAGMETPLVIAQKQITAPQAEKLKFTGTKPSSNSSPQHAIEFMRDTIYANPGEIVLLAVGPMTNLAHLFTLDPKIPSLLKSVVIMAGKYSDYPTPWGPTEWNAIVDPHAIDQVFRAAAGNITAFGLDITWQVSMTPREVKSRFEIDPLLDIVKSWSEVRFRERSLLHFHDPLAAAALFKPDICNYAVGDVRVDFSTPKAAGITHFSAGPSGAIRVANQVRPALFFDEYFRPFAATSHQIGLR